MIRKFVQFFSSLEEQEVGVATPPGVDLKPIEESVDDELVRHVVIALVQERLVGLLK